MLDIMKYWAKCGIVMNAQIVLCRGINDGIALDKTISECVLSTTQTYVDALKKQGKFDADAQKVAFQKTFDAVMGILTDDAKEYLGEAVSDLNAYIGNKIEANVKNSK